MENNIEIVIKSDGKRVVMQCHGNGTSKDKALDTMQKVYLAFVVDLLKKELTDIKYDALTRSSELMERSRQSRIEKYISTQESQLQTSTNPPYLIR